jgi:hypothetical protein
MQCAKKEGSRKFSRINKVASIIPVKKYRKNVKIFVKGK